MPYDLTVGNAVPGVPAGRAKSLLPGWCSAQRIKNPLIAGGNHTTIPSCRQSVPRNRLVTEEECGRQCNVFGYVKTSTWASSSWRHRWRSVIFYGLSGSRPHSSPDPLPRATLPPGEGIFPDACGIGGTARRPFPTEGFESTKKSPSGWTGTLRFYIAFKISGNSVKASIFAS